MKLTYYIKKIRYSFHIELVSLRDFGVKVAWLHFLKSFIFRRNSGVGARIYTVRYDTLKDRISDQFAEVEDQYFSRQEREEDSLKIGKDAPIWMFWWQGIDTNTPKAVIDCLQSINTHKSAHVVHVISKNNIHDYLNLPKFYTDLLNGGKMSFTHFSDIIRFELLAQYGGIWLDATIMLTSDLPSIAEESQFYTIHHGQFSDWHVSLGKWSTFCIASGKGNPMMAHMRDMNRAYWQKYDYSVCYLLIDCFIAIAYDRWAYFREIMDTVPLNNPDVFFLDDHANSGYKKVVADKIFSRTIIFKLHYKRTFCEYDNENQLTYYGKVVNDNRNIGGESLE
ncbi:capsular polysaccharide synthesis protein [Lactiplantibacillus argentoratensis]|nr:capsular polysaccharide synthesis protein [Lactiplantibacillus argentoratensis]